jgi:hypothetical protein
MEDTMRSPDLQSDENTRGKTNRSVVRAIGLIVLIMTFIERTQTIVATRHLMQRLLWLRMIPASSEIGQQVNLSRLFEIRRPRRLKYSAIFKGDAVETSFLHPCNEQSTDNGFWTQYIYYSHETSLSLRA